MSNRLNSPLGAALITALFISVFVFARLSLSSFDWSSFVVAGDTFCNPAQVPASLTVLPQSDGYDGQFYYRLALNPVTSTPTASGVTLDAPAYRHQRILYSTLAFVLSLGRTDLVPMMMVVINCISLCVLAALGAIYAQRFGQSAWWGVFLSLQPAFLFTLSRDLVEILEVMLVVASLLLIQRARFVLATAVLVFAILTRETALLVAIGALLLFAFERWKQREEPTVRWYYFTFPLAVFVLWQAVLFFNWGNFPHRSGTGLLGFPFVGPATFFWDTAALRGSFARRTLLELIFLILYGGGILLHLRQARGLPLGTVCCLLYGALAISLSREVWGEDWAFFRAVSQFCALGALLLIASSSRSKALVLGGSGLFWLYSAARLMRHYA